MLFTNFADPKFPSAQTYPTEAFEVLQDYCFSWCHMTVKIIMHMINAVTCWQGCLWLHLICNSCLASAHAQSSTEVMLRQPDQAVVQRTGL